LRDEDEEDDVLGRLTREALAALPAPELSVSLAARLRETVRSTPAAFVRLETVIEVRRGSGEMLVRLQRSESIPVRAPVAGTRRSPKSEERTVTVIYA